MVVAAVPPVEPMPLVPELPIAVPALPVVPAALPTIVLFEPGEPLPVLPIAVEPALPGVPLPLVLPAVPEAPAVLVLPMLPVVPDTVPSPVVEPAAVVPGGQGVADPAVLGVWAIAEPAASAEAAIRMLRLVC